MKTEILNTERKSMRVVCVDGSSRDIPTEIEKQEDYIKISISKEQKFCDIERIELDFFGVIAEKEDEGYMVLPRGAGCNDFCLCFFERHNKNFIYEISECAMPVFGVKSKNKTFLAIVSGMPYDYKLRVCCDKDGFRIYPVFEIHGEQPYEDLTVEYFMLSGKDADYSGMARCYRKYKETSCGLIPLKERAKKSETLAYAIESVMVRIRCGWKPAPPSIRHQTLENEPEMRVACSFSRIEDILDELKAQKVEKAEICLVGWNVKGHDGRWPQAFPVCEELGGEDGLRKLIRKAQSMGYQIVCHTNSTDQYEIADNYDAENTRRNREGKPEIDPYAWSGGECSQLCPQIAYDQAEELLPKIAELGFRGTHYIDVVGIVQPRACCHKAHPVNTGEAAEYAKKLCCLSKKLFGGMSSEGANDFIAPFLDFGLYVGMGGEGEGLCDKAIPFWQLVYHGYVLSNPYSYTMNYTLKDKKTQLKLIEYGGRPSYYFYSAFRDDSNNSMGLIDALCDTDEQLKETVVKIKEGFDEYTELAGIHTAFMENHTEVKENVYEITYSDGTVIEVDYNNEKYTVRKV